MRHRLSFPLLIGFSVGLLGCDTSSLQNETVAPLEDDATLGAKAVCPCWETVADVMAECTAHPTCPANVVSLALEANHYQGGFAVQLRSINANGSFGELANVWFDDNSQTCFGVWSDTDEPLETAQEGRACIQLFRQATRAFVPSE